MERQVSNRIYNVADEDDKDSPYLVLGTGAVCFASAVFAAACCWICFWICCTLFIVFYEAAALGFKSEIEGGEYSFFRVVIAAVLMTLVGALILGSIDVLYLSKLLRK